MYVVTEIEDQISNDCPTPIRTLIVHSKEQALEMCKSWPKERGDNRLVVAEVHFEAETKLVVYQG